MRARLLLALALASMPALAGAQAIVTSPKADKVAVTVYRAPYGEGSMNLAWLQGFAMVRETRRVSLPAGESELRFEGVAGGIVPQSALVEGLGGESTSGANDMPWGQRVAHIKDPDGNVVNLTQTL